MPGSAAGDCSVVVIFAFNNGQHAGNGSTIVYALPVDTLKKPAGNINNTYTDITTNTTIHTGNSMSQETPPPSYSAATKPDKGEKGKEENEPKSMLGGLFGGLFGGFGGGGGVTQAPAAAGGGLFGAPAQGSSPQFCCGAPPPMTPMKKKKGKSSSRSRVGGAVDIRRIGYDVERDRDAELVGVIVTVCAGSSYDNLFTAIRQQGADGTRTAVWKVNPSALRGIVAALEASALHSGSGEQTDEQTADASAETSAKAHPTRPTGAPATDLDTMVGEIMSVDPASVAFNWECCSGCSAAGFGSEADTHAALSAAEYAVSHGHMAMFSDFSLMALIKDWRDAVLGPNPFRQFGSFSGSMELKFDPPTLEASPSAQLQTLGKLAEEGTATVHVMGGTIAYTVDAAGATAGAEAAKYALEVLTVAESFSDGTAIPRAAITRTGAHTGAAGHVVLTYEVGGGTLLTSCGHWIELSKLEGDAVDAPPDHVIGVRAAAVVRNVQSDITRLHQI